MENLEFKVVKPLAQSLAEERIVKKEKINSLTHNLEKYKKILEITKLLSKELNLNNSLEISNLYTYLLWNGYFSKDKFLKHQNKGRIVIPGMYSEDIMSGIGTCLNFSDMLTDFLNEFEFSSATLINISDQNANCNYDVKIERNRSKIHKKKQNKLTFNYINLYKKIIGTHAFNLIKENDRFYIYDTTQLSAFKIKNKKKATIISGSGYAYLKPYTSYAYNFTQKAINVLNEFNNLKKFESPYDDIDFIETWEKCLELVSNNINLLNDFYNEIQSDILKIYKTNDKYYLTIDEIIKAKKL